MNELSIVTLIGKIWRQGRTKLCWSDSQWLYLDRVYRRRWILQLHWLIGTIGRTLVFAGIEVGSLLWAARESEGPDLDPGSAIFIGLVVLATTCTVAALWAVVDGVLDLPFQSVVARWAVVVAITGIVAPVYNQISDTSKDYGVMASDWLGGLLILGMPVVIVALGGWHVGHVARAVPAATTAATPRTN